MINKTNTNYSKRIEGTKLYREDIEFIISRVEKSLQKVEIHDANNMYDNIDEVIEHQGLNPKKITINAEKVGSSLEYFSLDVNKNYVVIISRGSEEMYSLGLEIEERIKSREDKFYTKSKPTRSLYLTIITLLYLFFGNHEQKGIIYKQSLICIVIFLAIITLISFSYKYLWNNLTLSRRHDYGFWIRNNDKIILTLISMIIGSILTIFLQLIISK